MEGEIQNEVPEEMIQETPAIQEPIIQDPVKIILSRIELLEEDNKKFKEYHKATADKIKYMESNFKLAIDSLQ